MVQRTITVDIPENLDKLTENVARLLLYPSIEKFLEEAVVSLSLKTMLQTFDYYVDPGDLEKRYGLSETKREEPEIGKNENSHASQLLDRNAIVETLETVTDDLSLIFQSKDFQEFLEENPVIRRTIYGAQQSLVEMKQTIQESGEIERGISPTKEGAPENYRR